MPTTFPAHRFSIRLRDTDAAGVLFFSRLLEHAHDAYESWMTALGFPLARLLEDGAHLPLVHVEADYLAPLRLGDEVEVIIDVRRLGNSSFELGYDFLLADKQKAAHAASVHVVMDPSNGQSMALPEDLRRAISDAWGKSRG